VKPARAPAVREGMDCYFHANVPSIAQCADCKKPICATCRDDRGSCPSCRLGAKIDAASATRQSIGGQVPPRPQYAPPPTPQPHATVTVSAPADPIESRALVALGYPLWPLALLGLLERKKSRYLKKQALQALGLNLGFAGLWGLLSLASNIPWFQFSAWMIWPFVVPLFLVSSVYFGIRVWQGDEVNVPIIGDWIEEKLPAA
jgi:uncharacterized membrane protein